jgi:serine protease DegS
MLSRLGSALVFVAGSVVGGLALAFLIVALRPELIRGPARSAPVATLAPPPPPVEHPPPPEGSYAAAVQRAAPSVVNVYTARVVTERMTPSLGELFGEIMPRYRQRLQSSLGSGVIIDKEGHIVTNNHVIENAQSIRVQLGDGRIADARIVGRDPDTDLAVLQIDLTPLPVAVIGRSDQLRVGDVVLAIGDPIGLSQTVTHGIVSATGRQQLGIALLEDFIQTDAPINEGNSGGALVDASGALVGINTAMVAKSVGVQGIGFAIPINMVNGVMHDIIAHGRVVRGWIGIVPEDLSEEQARQFGLQRGGVVIANLYIGSPAQRAGLQPGDVLLTIDKVAPRSAQDALARIAARAPGGNIEMRYQRGGREFEASAQVGERPHNG